MTIVWGFTNTLAPPEKIPPHHEIGGLPGGSSTRGFFQEEGAPCRTRELGSWVPSQLRELQDVDSTDLLQMAPPETETVPGKLEKHS